MNNGNAIDFNFSLLALKLLGKNLYSNPTAAISELVANSLDANASKVKVMIDMRDKQNSILEVFDDGIGMSLEDIKNKYCKIGYDKRKDINLDKVVDPKKVMGRKGIGKLAGLYLSDLYYVISRKNKAELNIWKVDIRNMDNSKENTKASMFRVHNISEINIFNSEIKNQNQGTLIRVEGINLKGLGDATLEALKWKLANYFAVDKLTNRRILIKIILSNNDLDSEYEEVEKYISFKNMIKIIGTYKNDSNFYKNNILTIQNDLIEFKPKKLKDNQYFQKEFEKKREYISISELINQKKLKIEYKGNFDDNNTNIPYELKGWIGIHSTLRDDGEAKSPDQYKNFRYNRNQLRLYVRNKLAIEDFLPKLRNTQAMINYIEGEIFFDVLDDNEWEDIATSNRQDINENDKRVIKLIELIKPIVNELITSRLKIKEEVNKHEIKVLNNINTNNKTEFIKKLKNSDFSKKQINLISSEIKGEIIKDSARIFLSHSSENKKLVDFIYESLLSLGVTNDEIFYTSKDIGQFTLEDQENIMNTIKDNIVDKDTLMFYFVSPDFITKPFPLFEAGAGWVTKAENQFIIMTHNTNLIKTKLEVIYNKQNLHLYTIKDKSKKEKFINFLNDSEKVFNYNNFIIPIFNKCIRHLNNKRKIKNLELLKELEVVDKHNWNERVNNEILTKWSESFTDEVYDEIFKKDTITLQK